MFIQLPYIHEHHPKNKTQWPQDVLTSGAHVPSCRRKSLSKEIIGHTSFWRTQPQRLCLQASLRQTKMKKMHKQRPKKKKDEKERKIKVRIKYIGKKKCREHRDCHASPESAMLWTLVPDHPAPQYSCFIAKSFPSTCPIHVPFQSLQQACLKRQSSA